MDVQGIKVMSSEQFPGAGVSGESFDNFGNHTSSSLMKWSLVASGLTRDKQNCLGRQSQIFHLGNSLIYNI